MNRHSIIRHVALCCAFAGALLCPPPAVAVTFYQLCKTPTTKTSPSTLKAQDEFGAQGFGAVATGGNAYAPTSLPPPPNCGGAVSDHCLYTVTSLKASGPGTLNDAVSQGNRYIVFGVSGTITLRTGIMVKGANITIDGCSTTLPSSTGITLKGAGLYIHGKTDPACTGGCDVHDIIVRNIRTRRATSDGSSSDGFRVAYSAYNIVFDHVSADFSGDGNIDITEHSHDVTVSWSIFSNPKSTVNSLLAYEPSQLTMHHNVFMKSSDRNPFSAFDYADLDRPNPCYCPAGATCDSQCLPHTSDPSQAQTTLDFWNNLVWNWGGGRGSILWYHSQNNVVNNYYDSPGGDNADSLIVCSSSVPAAHVGDCNSIPAYPPPKNYAWAYVDGNYNPDFVQTTDEPTINDVGTGKVNTPFPGLTPTDSACTAARNVISSGGAGTVPLDSVDQANLASITLRVSGGC